jgi:hypothetical protein
MNVINATEETKGLGGALLGSLKDVAGMIEDLTATGRTVTRTAKRAAELLESMAIRSLEDQELQMQATSAALRLP